MTCFPVSPDTQQRLRTYWRLRDHCIQFQLRDNSVLRRLSSIIKKFGDWHATDPLKIGVWCNRHAEVPLQGMNWHSFLCFAQCNRYSLCSHSPWPFPPIESSQQQARKPWFVQSGASQDVTSTRCLEHASSLYAAHCSVVATLRPWD